MDCIYLNCDEEDCECHAQPLRDGEPVPIWYQPTEDELKNYCRAKEFILCPRYKAFHNYLRSQGKSQSE